MSEFTFDLGSLKSSVGSFEQGLSANTPDDKLTYSGNDPIVWDRVNNERLRRGLSPLPGPRPVDDGKTYGAQRGTPPANTAPNRPLTEAEKAQAAAIAKQFGVPDPVATAETFKLSCPPGTTREQAFEIFKKQADAGGLTGFAPGDILSAETQAKDGLEEAKAELAQARSGFPGTDKGVLNSFKNIADTAKQSIAAGTTGKSLGDSVGVFGSVAKDTIGKIGALFGTPVTSGINGINTADFAKTAAAVMPMAGLSTVDVRATVASVGTATGQDFSQFTNGRGAGKYGFNATQLETAGLVKPGTAGKFLSQGANELTDVLKSPAVWTGKGGINSLDGLLSSPAAQTLAQQDLMSKGLSTASQLGLPIKDLTAKDQGGLASVFSKDSAEGAGWIRGQLPADKQAEFDKQFAEAKFAIGSADDKFNDAMLQETPPGEATDTVNRETLTAALGRVFGNDKIPPIDYNGPPQPPGPLFAENKRLKSLAKEQQTKLLDLGGKEATASTADALIAQYESIRKYLEKLAKDYASLQKDVAGKAYKEFIAEVDAGAALVLALIDDIRTLYLPNLRRIRGA
jgi:hypothetical protein